MKKGLYKDTSPELQPTDTSPFLKNWNHNKQKGTITNEESLFLITLITEDFVPIGKIILDSEKTVIFSRNIYEIDEHSEIGILNKGVYTTLVKDSLLNFKLTNQIVGEFKINIKSEEIIYFTDDLNFIKYLNLSTLNDVVDGSGRITDIDGLRFFPTFIHGDIDLISVNDNGGSLKSGVYYISYAYIDGNGNSTNFLNISNQISITNSLKGVSSLNAGYGLYDGVDANSDTSKSFTIKISNLDNSYSNIRVAIIQVIDQSPSVSYIDYPIVSSNVNFTYTGNETTTIGSLSDILVDRPSYKTAKDIVQYQSQLYFANLTGQRELGFQKYANNISISYSEKSIKLDIEREAGTGIINTDKDEVVIYDELGFMDDEAYAFYIGFLLKDGSWSRAYHIPGRKATILGINHGLGRNNFYLETDTINSIIAGEKLPGGNYGIPEIKSYLDGANYISGVQESKLYQVLNTANRIGKMGFWENENETYPDTDDWDVFDSSGQIDTLRNNNVRHHKFPNPASPYPTIPYYNRTGTNTCEGRVFGIKLSNVYIPDEIKNEIQGYGIFYAQRNDSSSLVLSQGSPMFPRTESTPNDLETIGRNRRLFKPNPVTDKVMEFSGFDMMIEQSRLENSVFIKNEFTLLGELVDSNFGGTIDGLTNYTKGSRTNNQNQRNDYIRQILAKAEIPHNNINNPINTLGFSFSYSNKLGQRKFLYEIKPTNLSLQVPTDINGISLGQFDVPGYLSTVYAYKEDLYNQFDQQLLRFTGTIIKDLTSSTSQDIYGGDTFYNSFGFRGTGQWGNNVTDQVRNINYIAIKSYYHTGYRQDGPDLSTTNEEDFYYPKQNNTDIFNLQAWAEEKFTVNKDYSLGNYLNPVLPNDKNNTVNEEDYSNRVIRSEKDNKEAIIDNYRIFLPLNYKDVDRDKGEIWRIETYNNILLIHNTRVLRRTIGTENIKTDNVSAILGAGNIFTIDPKELIQTDEGYGGTQCQWSSIVTPYGYFFLDTLSGTPLLLSEGLTEISNGLLNYFKDNLDFTLPKIMKNYGIDYKNVDNPNSPYGIGTVSFYDHKYERIIFSKKDFEPLKEVKVANYNASFGDYFENDLVYGRDKFYKVEYPFTRDVDLTKQITTDTLGSFSQVFTQLSLSDAEFFKDLSFTVSYYPEYKFWGSFYDFKPNFMFHDNKHSYSSIDNRIFKHNSEFSRCFYYDGVVESVADVIINSNSEQKTYGSISWVTKSEIQGVELPLDTFTKAIVFNSKQCSGEIDLVNLKTIRKSENKWNFNKFRDLSITGANFFIENKFNSDAIDINKRWYQQNKFQDRYLATRLFYSNINTNELTVISVSSDYLRISPR